MRKIGNIILGALIMLVGLVILTESNDNHIDIKISDNENLSVDNIKNEKLSKNAVTVTQKSIAKKNIDDPEDEPLANTIETKVNREVSKIYASDKIDENGKEGNGKYLYVELAEDTKNNNIVAQTDLDSVKISVSQDNNNYFIGSKSFNVNGK